ncbi:MAG: sugar kinase [Elsteraceae bacterium]
MTDLTDSPQDAPWPDLLCMGEAMVEFNQSRDDGRYLQGFGGDTSNCAIAAARLGAKSGYLSAVGSDPFGDWLMALWREEGVDARTVARSTAAPTGVYFVTHGPAGHAFTYFRAGSAASQMRTEALPTAALDACRYLHVSGISQAISESACDAAFAAMARVRAAGGRISYDTNLRLKLWSLPRARAVIHGAIAQADVALPSLEDAVLLTGLERPDAIADFYLRLGCPLVVLKCGENGPLVATPDRREAIPGHKVATVDATGAGDVFGGAFLARRLAGDDPFEAAVFANATAALSTTGYGAVAPIPSQAQVRAFLASR